MIAEESRVAEFTPETPEYTFPDPIQPRRGLMRKLLGSGRTPNWERADRDYHAKQQTCEMCGGKAGPIGPPFDTQVNNSGHLEAHDVQPYHLLTTEQQNDYDFIMSNFIMLHWHEHRRIAHAGDPDCLMYNPNIREMAAYILAQKKNAIK